MTTNTIPLDCPPDKVPGWLDEHGNPQGCVDNNPTPGKPKDEPAPVETPEQPAPAPEAPQPPAQVETAAETIVEVGTAPAQAEELALTGGEVAIGGLLALALIAAGLALVIRGKISGVTR